MENFSHGEGGKHHHGLDFQVENQLEAAYISRTALVPIQQYPSQMMSKLKFFMGVCMDPDTGANKYQLITMANINFGHPQKAAKIFHDVVTLTMSWKISAVGGSDRFL